MGETPAFVTLRASRAEPLRLRRAATSANLNNHHRNTVEEIFSHPTSGNIEWRNVLSLIEAVGTAVEEHNGKLKVTIGSQSEVIRPPHGKDIDAQLIADLRKLLAGAGYSPAS